MIRGFFRVWLSIVGKNCGQGIGFHLILKPWIKLIRFDKKVQNWKVEMIKVIHDSRQIRIL